MSNSNDGGNGWIVQQLIWIAISLAISITLSFFLPFYISLPIMIVIFLAMTYFVRRRAMAKMGMLKGGSLFGGGSGIKYYCMNCSHKHNQAACPKCGSKLKKAGF